MFLRRFLRFAAVLAVIVGCLFIISRFWMIVMPFLISYVIFFFLKPYVAILERRDVPHLTSVLIVFIVFFGAILVFGAWFIPHSIDEMISVQDNIPQYKEKLDKNMGNIQESLFSKIEGIQNMVLDDDKDFETEIGAYVTESMREFARKIPAMFLNILPLMINLFIIPFATFFYLLDSQRMKKNLVGLVPNQYFELTLSMIHSINRQFSILMKGMLFSAFVISLLTSFFLWIIGLDYPIFVGIFAGLANLIPYMGPLVGTVAAMIVSLITDQPPLMYLYIVIVFAAVNLIDNTLVQPMVLSRAANLHPLMVIVIVLVGSQFGGVFGMLLAVPAASFLKVIFSVLNTALNRPIRPPFSKYRDAF